MKASIGIKNKGETIRLSVKGISPEYVVKFSRLSLEEIPQISNLLMSVWPAKYGPMRFPKYDEDYLNWIFGGPNKERHILFGGKIQNDLVTYCSFLYRRILYSGDLFDGYIHTHLTILPHLSSRVRFNCLLQMADIYANTYLSANCVVMCGISEEKASVRDAFGNLIQTYTKMEVKERYQFGFNQYFILADKLLKYCEENVDTISKVQVRDALEEDYGEITKLFNSACNTKREFIVQMTESELRHHFCGHPTHRTTVIEIQGAIQGFINYYPLETIKNGKESVYIIIEYLILHHINIDYMAKLLREAVNFAIKIGAKGVVIENGTYLDYNTYRVLGVMPTFRRMVMDIYSRNNLINNLDYVRCDVK
jgi:hypothetical protein